MSDQAVGFAAYSLTALSIHALGFLMGPAIGSVALLVSLLLFAGASWFAGRAFGKRWTVAAVFVGAGLGVAFWFLDWRWLHWVSVSLLHTESENGFIEFQGPFSLFMLPLALGTAVTGGLGAWMMREPRNGADANGTP